MKRFFTRMAAAWQRLNTPAPTRCHECGQRPPRVALAPGAHFCAECSKPTPSELERIQRNLHGLEQPHRRRDGSTLPGTVELWP